MIEDLEAADRIIAATERLLAAAGARGGLPTPVDDIIAAAHLSEPAESILSDEAINEAPSHIREKIAKLTRKVRAVLDRRAKEVHLHPEIQLEGQRNFKRLHEVSHEIFDWQRDLAYADDSLTLSWSTNILFERQANQGAAELLFQRGLLTEMAAEERIGFATIVDLSERFGASIHATFRRYVETHRGELAGLVLDRSPSLTSPLSYRRYEAVQSRRWTQRFGLATTWPFFLPVDAYPFLDEAHCLAAAPVPRMQMTWPDVNGTPISITIEIFDNNYKILVLLWQPQWELLKPRRVLVAPSTRPYGLHS